MADLNSMAASLGALLKQREQTVGVSESSAGGLISASLVSIPGASAYYVGGAVIYTHTARQGLLMIPDDAMPVSGPAASLMHCSTPAPYVSPWGPPGA